MGLSRVRAVFFDLDNTLIDTAGASRKGMLEVTSCLPLPFGEPRALAPRAPGTAPSPPWASGPLTPEALCAGRPARSARGVCERTALAARGLPEGCR